MIRIVCNIKAEVGNLEFNFKFKLHALTQRISFKSHENFYSLQVYNPHDAHSIALQPKQRLGAYKAPAV